MFDKNMSNEEKLDAIYKMTLENHEVLRIIRRQQFLSTLVRLLYWLIVLGFIGGAYFYLQPLIASITDKSAKIEDTMLQFNQLKDQLPETKVLNQVMEGLKKTAGTPQ